MGWRGNAQRGARRRRARGQALVEFALVAPIFFLLLFGVIEFSVINTAIGIYNFAAKDAARLGAIRGPTDANIDQEMVSLIAGRVVGLPTAHIVRIEIYQSDETGAYSSANEDVYDGSGNPIGSATWPYSARNDGAQSDTANEPYLGVRITYQYTYLTAFFSSAGATLTLTADAVDRIEPTEYVSS